ncbi:TonB-dependent siderophore receptor [Ferrimonas sp. SCSIO 43195]|uniref:TonB-dependent receptor plug domain-containing protein n=1 Tax=Ferrimonas sp. SCSIO 43195 TaxID=2822844 RepID=UPI0020762D30|nr:TonB-dependent receptor [Ferrimonas sp. SCSIO 43195]USD39345.1 TonB-dependent receptor [Ferrimonas sp. SCSIO 43195]
MSTARFRLKPVAVLVATLCTSMAVAADETNEVETNEVETIQVWGTVVNNGSLLLNEDIAKKQADHLSDLLRDQAGVDIGGTHSMNQGINIRGVSELDLEITIDGVNQANNVFHHAGNLLINPDILKAVDLQVGNNSVLNGGLAGGVAFETKDARDLLKEGEKFGARLHGGYATNDYYNYSGTGYSQLTDQLDIMAYYSVFERDNPKDGEGVERVGQKGTTTNYLVKMGWDWNPDNRIEVSYDSYEDSGDYTLKSNMGPDYDRHEGMIDPIEYTRETISLNHELSLDSVDIRTSLYRNEMNYARTDENTGDPETEGDVSEGNTVVYGIKSLAESAFELGSTYHIVRYGFEYDNQESENLLNGQANKDSNETADTFAVYAEDEVELISGLFITPGVRYNHYKVDMAASNDTFTDTTFGLAAKYELTEQWTLRASATELFKGPALTGSFLTSGSALNPDLKPETGINYEAGIAFQEQAWAGFDSIGFSFNAFQTEIDDYIDDTMTGKASLYSNLGDVEIVGFESVLNVRRGDLSGRLTYSRSDSEFTSVHPDSGVVPGQSLEDEVGDSISFNLDYELSSLGLSLSWTSLVTMDLDKEVEQDTAKEGFDVHSINARWIPTAYQALTVTAGVENLFDEQYASHASHDFGYTDYEPGRNFKLSVAYVF